MKVKCNISVLFLLYSVLSFGQNKNCAKIDSNLCYINANYTPSILSIEKKFESIDTVQSAQVSLLADVDNDCIPDLIIPDILEKSILIIDSKTGLLKWKIMTPFIDLNLNGLAVADVDFDGVPELFFEASKSESSNAVGRLLCYRADGKPVWVSDQPTNKYLQFREKVGGTPALADFNQDGIPEIYVNNKIFNAQTGIKLADGGDNGIGTGRAVNFFSDALTIAAQLDEDSTDLELAAGFTVYKVNITNTNGMNGNSMTAISIQVDNEFKDGFTTVSDINLDGHLDVVVTTPGFSNEALLYAYTILNGTAQLIAKAYPPGIIYTGTGPAFIGDIKGLGNPSILTTRFSKLLSYSYNGSNQFQLDWSFTTTDSSGFTGLTMFDLNGDGIQEIIYRDETHLYIINGSKNSTKLLAKIPCLSITGAEYPIIGDIDNSGHAKICISCSFFPDGLKSKYTVFGPPDSLPGWAPARAVWNQYAYNPLYINDDLTVPRLPKNQVTYKNGKYNNFLQQESLLDSNGMYKVSAANLWGEIACVNYDLMAEEYTVSFNVFNHNNASARADSALPVSFYNGDPTTGSSLLGIFYTPSQLNPGDRLLQQEFKFKSSQIQDLYMVVNTKRDTIGAFDPKDFSSLECDYADNVFHTTELPKTEMISASICKGSTYPFFDTMLTNQGLYKHILRNQKNCDSLITLLELTVVDTIHSVHTLSVCDSFNWQGIVYRENATIVNHFQVAHGCDSVVTLNLNIRYSSDTLVQATGCRKFDFNDKVYTEGGKYFINLRNKQGCDSTIELHLSIIALDTNITKLGNTLIALDSVATYQWIDCNDHYAAIPGATQKSYTPDKDGSYAVIIRNPPCIDTTMCLPIIISNTIEQNGQTVYIYPNPVSHTLFIRIPKLPPTELILSVRDIHGSTVMKKILTSENRDVLELDVSNLSAGIYSMDIRSTIIPYQLIFLKM